MMTASLYTLMGSTGPHPWTLVLSVASAYSQDGKGMNSQSGERYNVANCL